MSWTFDDNLAACPGGDPVDSLRPHRLRFLVWYTDGSGFPEPRVDVPPESIWVTTTTLEPGNLRVNDKSFQVYADSATSAGGRTTVTIPSFSGCGRMRVDLFVSGVWQGSRFPTVRTTDSDADGRATQQDPLLGGVCDLNYDGQVDDADRDLFENHLNHSHRQALHGTPVQRTQLCPTCSPSSAGTLGIGDFSWDPTGRWLAYTAHLSEGPALNDCAVFIVGADASSGEPIRFTFPPPGGRQDDYDPSWSPLGHEIFFDRLDREIYRKGVPGAATDTSEILVTASGEPPFPGDIEPAVSPDGTRIVFARFDRSLNTFHLWTKPIRGGTSTRLTSLSTAIDRFPAWAPDGRWVYFQRRNFGTGRFTIHRVLASDSLVNTRPADAEQTVESVFASEGLDTSAPSPSEDGTVLLVARQERSDLPAIRRLLAVDPTTLPASSAVLNYDDFFSEGEGLFPQPAPDGTRTAFLALPPRESTPANNEPEENDQLWVSRPNMSLPPVLTHVRGVAIEEHRTSLNLSAQPGNLLEVKIAASDPEGDPITYRAFFLRPEMGMLFDPDSRRFFWVPPDSAKGKTFHVKFQVATPSGGTDFLIALIRVSGTGSGCPFLDTRADTGWVVENSVLQRSVSGALALDAYRLKGKPQEIEGRHRLRVWENEEELTTLDEVALAAVDRKAGESAYWLGAGPVVGVPEAAWRVQRSSGEEITELVDGGSEEYFIGEPGETLWVEFGSGSSPGVLRPLDEVGSLVDSLGLVIESGIKELPIDASQSNDVLGTTSMDVQVLEETGIVVEAPDGEGGWRKVVHHYPRESFDEALVDSAGGGPVRLVFVGRHAVRFLGRVRYRPAEAIPLVLDTARHSSLGDVLGLVEQEDGLTASLALGDTVELEFSAAPAPEGREREWFLLATGAYTSVAGTASAPGGIEHVEHGELPAGLDAARPNPASGRVTIGFTLARDGEISLRIYDIAGRLVRTLAKGRYPAGSHEVAWDGRGEGGWRLPGGVYLYRLAAEGRTSQRKLVLLTGPGAAR